MTNSLKLVLVIFFLSNIKNVSGQVDSNNITSKDIHNEAIQIRDKINNFMDEELLEYYLYNSNDEDDIDSQEDKLILMQSNLDDFLSIIYHQDFQMDSLISNLKLLESFIDLNSPYYKNEFNKKNINVFNLKSEQFYKFNKLDSVSIIFNKNVFKLNSAAMLTLDSVLPFLKKNNILLIGYYYKKEINNDYAVKIRLADIMLYLASKGINRSQISVEFVKDNDTQPIILTNKVSVLFGK
jgi:hypothetical protein